MIRKILSVSAWTLLSRVTGFIRDVSLGAILGAGMLNDAFVVAFRLPNHFRAIFGEGAFNAAYVPAYARTLERDGGEAAHRFASIVFTLLLLSQMLVLALAWTFTPALLDLLAPGFRDSPDKFALATTLTRITFPYLLCITLVTLMTGTLNASGRFAAGAFAPVLLNLSMIGALALAFLFPTAAHAAAVGVLVAGVAQLAFVAAASHRAGFLERLTWPRFEEPVRKFFRALGPAVIGSAGVQIALFADTIIGSLLPTGGLSSIYYADRLYQLPIGVIGIAAGTVLLPEMSRAFAAGKPEVAFAAQNRTLALTLLLATPCFVAFLLLPDLLMRAAFLRGRFTAEDAQAAAKVLFAYDVGLFPILGIAATRASFQSRGDTWTPMAVALAAIAANVLLKIALFQPYGASGLAIATCVGAWINILALLALAWRRGLFQPDKALLRVGGASLLAGVAMAIVTGLMRAPAELYATDLGGLADIAVVIVVGAAGLAVYAAVVLLALWLSGFDLSFLERLRRKRGGTKP